jgi:hypothetical protein
MRFDNVVFRCGACTLLLLCLVALGCSENVKVSGTVTYSDNGEPVKFGTVVFDGEKEVGRGMIKNGKYAAGVVKDGDGIPPGTYTISAGSPPLPDVSKMTVMGIDGQPIPMGSPPDPDREIYYTAQPQTIEIKKSMKYDFQVERGSPAH